MFEGEGLHAEVVLADDGPRQRWTGHGPTSRDQLARLVERLDRLAGLAVPVVVATHVGEPSVVDLSWSGPTTLASMAVAEPARARELLATVAGIVQAAHRRGVGHGRIEPASISIEPGGRPVLTGFDPDFDLTEEGADADADAISRLANELLTALPRVGFRRVDREAIAALRAVAEPRPHTIAELVTLTESTGRSSGHRSPRRAPPPGSPGLAAAVVVVVGAALAAVTLTRSPPEPVATPPTTSTNTTGRPAPPPTAVNRCPAIDGPGADIDGDGCLESVTVDGTLVSSGAASWQVGTDGDQIVVGDWDCDGKATPAVLRPATGAVFVFSSWADRTPVSVAPSELSPGLAELWVDDPDGDGCHRLLGVDAYGARWEIGG
ncbi:MAG: hypothetical protein GY745_21105 [Actinomycetia bacterium]|nr:hypothetical protein [Actinomycetes bacterium]